MWPSHAKSQRAMRNGHSLKWYNFLGEPQTAQCHSQYDIEAIARSVTVAPAGTCRKWHRPMRGPRC